MEIVFAWSQGNITSSTDLYGVWDKEAGCTQKYRNSYEENKSQFLAFIVYVVIRLDFDRLWAVWEYCALSDLSSLA